MAVPQLFGKQEKLDDAFCVVTVQPIDTPSRSSLESDRAADARRIRLDQTEKHYTPKSAEDASVLETATVVDKVRESCAFAGAALYTFKQDLPRLYHASSPSGRFAHYIVEPLHKWYGRNQRVAIGQPLNTVRVQDRKEEGSTMLINTASFNYAGTYQMPPEYEAYQQECLQILPTVDVRAVPLIENAVHSEIAAFLGTDCCFTTATGYQSNILAMTAILDDSWLVILDSKCHSSLFTGSYLSNAGERKRFKHNDAQSLEMILAETYGRYSNTMVVIEGLYSLDGTLPDLSGFSELKQRYNFTLYCDEAHSFMSLGKSGRGCLEHWNDTHPVNQVPSTLIDVRTGTCSKAVLSVGGFVAATDTFRERLHARHDELLLRGESISTSAMLQFLWNLRRPMSLKANFHRSQAISRHCYHALQHAGVQLCGSDSVPMLLVIAGRPSKASKLSYVLRKHGVLATPFSAPAVPIWASRVRMTLSPALTDEDVNALVAATIKSCRQVGILRASEEATVPQMFHSSSRETAEEEKATWALEGLWDLVKQQRLRSGSKSNPRFLSLPFLSTSGELIGKAGREAIADYNLGSGPRWIAGTTVHHTDVEGLVAKITQQDAALTYPESETGLMSTVAALCRPLARATTHSFVVPQGVPAAVDDGFRIASRSCGTARLDYHDLGELQSTLECIGASPGKQHVTLWASAKGLEAWAHHIAPLLSRLSGVTVLVDDSDGFLRHRTGIAGEVDVNAISKMLRARMLIFGSFHRSFGLSGGYLAGSKALIDELRYTSRCYVFSAAPQPHNMAMVGALLQDRLGQVLHSSTSAGSSVTKRLLSTTPTTPFLSYRPATI